MNRFAVAITLVLMLIASSALAQYQPGIPSGPGYTPPGGPGYSGPSGPDFGGPDFGGPTGPGYEPPTFPDTSTPTYEYVEYKYCESCGNQVSDSASVGQKCPHCGVTWNHDETTGETSSSGGFSGRGLGKLIGGAVALLFLIGGGIAKAVSR